MNVKGKVAVITGAASGIGRATALKFHAEGAAGVVVADLNEAGLQPVAQAVNGLAVRCDVSKESDIQALVAAADQRVADPSALLQLVERSTVGQPLPLRVIRGQQELSLSIKPSAMPPAA
jgi:NAD(P)-dependent dehydrogenase (short-subunit alcohol dehydrogenase family)